MNSTRSLTLCRWIILFTAILLIAGEPRSGDAYSASPTLTSVQAQACPTIKVSGPYEVKEGEPLTLTVSVTGGPSKVTPTYNWTVSAGAISEGQGTAIIKVDTAGVGGGTITASVDLGGYDRSCSTSFTASVSKPSRKVAEYGKLKPAEEQTLLDKFAAEMEKDDAATGYILAYGGPQSPKSEASQAAAKVSEYLIKQRHIDLSRLIFLEGGARDKFTIEPWVVPSGATPPEIMPTAKPDAAKPTTKPTKKKRR